MVALRGVLSETNKLNSGWPFPASLFVREKCARPELSMLKLFLFFHVRLQWMLLVSTAVLYNLIFVLGRAVFWELNNAVPHFWWFLDYMCDTIYLVDFVIHAHEGKSALGEFPFSTSR